MRAESAKGGRSGAAPKKIFYLIYAGALVCIFAYRLFPSEQVFTYLSDRLAVAAPGYSLAVDSLKPVFPPALRLGGVGLTYRQQEMLQIDELIISPRLQGILRWQPLFSLEGKTYGGRLEGRTEIEEPGGLRRIRLRLVFSGIDLESIPRITELTGYKIAGILDGEALVSAIGPVVEKMTASLVINGAAIDPPAPVMAVSRLRFERLGADILYSQGTLSILESRFEGPQMDGRIAGTIAVKRPLGASRLDLEGTVRPHTEFLAMMQGSVTAARDTHRAIGKNGFSFSFSGTYDRPAVALTPGTPR